MANDPNFPPGPTFGKNLVITGPVIGDKQAVANFFGSAPQSGSKLSDWTTLTPAQCSESDKIYNKYSVSVDKPSPHTVYSLVLVGSQGATALGASDTAVAMGKPATNNNVVFSPGNNANDCHSAGPAITGADFYIYCRDVFDACKAAYPNDATALVACNNDPVVGWPALTPDYDAANTLGSASCTATCGVNDWCCGMSTITGYPYPNDGDCTGGL